MTYARRNLNPTRLTILGRIEGARGLLGAAFDALNSNRPTTARALLGDAREVLDAADDELHELARQEAR